MIKQKPSQNDLGNFYQRLYHEKLYVFYQQKQYKKIIKIAKGKKNSPSYTYYFSEFDSLSELKDLLISSHLKGNAQKEGLDIKEVKFN